MSTKALVALGTGTLRWIEWHLASFRVSAPDDDLCLAREIKPIAELALVCDLLLRNGSWSRFGKRLTAPPDEILARCWRELDEGEHIRRLLLNYPDLFSVVTTYPPFWRAGLKNKALENAIRSLSRDPSIQALEFPSWRLIDFAFALRSLGIHSPWKPEEEFTRTWLGRSPVPWMLSDSAAYSLTHTVFYMTDFGTDKHGLPHDTVAYISRWIKSWCLYFARAQNLDLLGEMLMVGYCLGVGGMSDPLRRLLDGQRADGCVPGPLFTPRSHGTRHRSGGARQRFLYNYHTTVVALMASVLGLAAARRRTEERWLKNAREGKVNQEKP